MMLCVRLLLKGFRAWCAISRGSNVSLHLSSAGKGARGREEGRKEKEGKQTEEKKEEQKDDQDHKEDRKKRLKVPNAV